MNRIWRRVSVATGTASILICGVAQADTVSISGEMQAWRPVTIDIAGPATSELDDINPFADYRLDVVFENGTDRLVVPGYYAACGEAGETGCTQGNVWRVHFTPGEAGHWEYRLQFKTGTDVAFTDVGHTVPGIDGRTGHFVIADAGQPSADPRNRGRLIYTGERYARYAATGDVFFKMGADAPENMLAYDGFDATPNVKNLRKSWAAHEQDVSPEEVEQYGWNGNGRGILGAVSYLADSGLNSVSFLTFNIGGDDRNVFPHLLKMPMAEYEAYSGNEDRYLPWETGVHKDRFDVSKLDQWARVMQFANDQGMFLHFKLQETENDHLMDGGETGRERTLYLREMIARFGHFLALNWNVGEENNRDPALQIAMAQKIAELDPYGHLRVIHSYPEEKHRYHNLLGEGSAITGVSLQGHYQSFADIRPDVIEWDLRSRAAGQQWVLSYDEPGSASGGAPVDEDYPDHLLPASREIADMQKHYRGQVFWNALTAGATGVEVYYGYKTGCSDLDCQDHRSRARKWQDASIALDFFHKHVGNKALDMEVLDRVSDVENDFVFGVPGEIYVIYSVDGRENYMSTGQAHTAFSLSWFDPRAGGEFVRTLTLEADDRGRMSIPQAPRDLQSDWVLLIQTAPSE